MFEWSHNWFVCFLFLFFAILFYIERKRLLMRNVAPILPLKSKLSGKFQRFNAINRCIEMLKIVEFSKISIKIQNCKTFCKAQTTNRLNNFFQSPSIPPPTTIPQGQTLLRLRNNFFLRRYIEIYRHLLSKCFKNAVLGRQEMGQCKCFFWHQTESCLVEHLERFLAVLWESILFSMSVKFKFIKWVRFFEPNCIVNWLIFFTSFCWLWDFLPENLKLK